MTEYALTMVADSRERMNKFVTNFSDLVSKEYRTTLLIIDMDISYFMIHSQQIEEEKLKKAIDSKKPRTCDGDFSHSRSNGQVRFNYMNPKFNSDRVSNSKPE